MHMPAPMNDGARPAASNRPSWLQRAGLMLVAMLIVAGAQATTIMGMDVDRLANDAELIFEGEVIAVNARQQPGSGIIHTYITFTVLDVIKGNDPGPTLELRFMGGSHEGKIVQVTGMTQPRLGEQGIYFVESLSQDMVNPLLGWSQGHYIIDETSGDRRVRTVDNKPVTAIESLSRVPLLIKRPNDIIQGDSEAANGIATAENELQIDRALTASQFKARLLDIIGN